MISLMDFNGLSKKELIIFTYILCNMFIKVIKYFCINSFDPAGLAEKKKDSPLLYRPENRAVHDVCNVILGHASEQHGG